MSRYGFRKRKVDIIHYRIRFIYVHHHVLLISLVVGTATPAPAPVSVCDLCCKCFTKRIAEADCCTKGQPVKERTAALAWQLLERIDLPVFLWNVFPLHPHEPERPFTNRSHRARERAAGEDILSELVSLLRPEVVVALGGDAARSSERLAPTLTVRVRHPSYGGQTQFLSQMSDLYRLSARAMQGDDLFDRSCAS
jgi:hypothetical protein